MKKLIFWPQKSVDECGKISMNLINFKFTVNKDKVMLLMHVSLFCCDVVFEGRYDWPFKVYNFIRVIFSGAISLAQ